MEPQTRSRRSTHEHKMNLKMNLRTSTSQKNIRKVKEAEDAHHYMLIGFKRTISQRSSREHIKKKLSARRFTLTETGL